MIKERVSYLGVDAPSNVRSRWSFWLFDKSVMTSPSDYSFIAVVYMTYFLAPSSMSKLKHSVSTDTEILGYKMVVPFKMFFDTLRETNKLNCNICNQQ